MSSLEEMSRSIFCIGSSSVFTGREILFSSLESNTETGF